MESLKLFMTNTKQAIKSLTGQVDWYAPPIMTMPQVAGQLSAITGQAAPTTPPAMTLEAVKAKLDQLDRLILYMEQHALLPPDWDAQPPV